MENSDEIVQKDPTQMSLLLVIVAIGILTIVFLILTLVGEDSTDADRIIVPDYQKQADEAVAILEMLKNAMLDPKIIAKPETKYAVQSINEGDNIGYFSHKFGILTGSYGQLHYYNNNDFVFHKGGGKPANGFEFYIEAKSSMKHRADTQENIDTELRIRLYSDGTIERYVESEKK
ncbi:MAG: hypothetical protein K8S87_09185 [Planctomycetes bacterium]|nr:hypothetical protein [Planctomycetota bacterium]